MNPNEKFQAEVRRATIDLNQAGNYYEQGRRKQTKQNLTAVIQSLGKLVSDL